MRPGFEHAQPHKVLASSFIPLLTGPLAFLADMQVSYSMVHPLCEGHERYQVLIPSLFSFAAVAAAAWVARSNWMAARNDALTRHSERRKFMGIAGVVMSLFSALLLVGLVIAKLLVHPCDL